MTHPIDLTRYQVERERFCYPDWLAIGDEIKSRFSKSQWPAEWNHITRKWVNQNCEVLGGEYCVHETDNFLILSNAEERVIRDACISYEGFLEDILKELAGAAVDDGLGKHVVFLLSDLDDYYEYVSHFYPEGEHPMSGGLCIGTDGYIHFAIPVTDYSSYRTVLVHELTHSCLAHLPLPVWLNEAVAMRMEQAICGTQNFFIDHDIYQQHCDHWNEQTIQEFWSGKSWEIQGDSFELSYSLAQILFRKLEVDVNAPRQEMMRFITAADSSDGGDLACRTIFNLSVTDLVSDFLGEGNWAPQLEENSKEQDLYSTNHSGLPKIIL